MVPFNDVFALDEMPVLLLERTVEFELVTEDGESAEVGLAFDAPVVVLTPPEDSAEVDDAGVARVVLEAGVSNAFPELDAAPEPAPEDEPAVFDAMVVGAVLIEVDWM